MRTLTELLQTNKRTGEIKTLPFPIYRGVNLCDVYGKWSNLKQTGIIYCYDLLHSFKPDEIIACGITSFNTFQFTFEAVFEKGGVKYVLHCTAKKDEVYLLAE